jgi:hypothetical protein
MYDACVRAYSEYICRSASSKSMSLLTVHPAVGLGRSHFGESAQRRLHDSISQPLVCDLDQHGRTAILSSHYHAISAVNPEIDTVITIVLVCI